MASGNFSMESKNDTKKVREMQKRTNIFIVLAVIFLILGIGGLCVVCGMYFATKLSETQYGIVFDAGSSHTSMYLYEWKSEKLNGTGQVSQRTSCEVKGGGLSSYLDNPSKAGESLTSCLDEASADISWAMKQSTPVYLGATAGMRIVKLEDAKKSKEIMDSARDVVSNSGFEVYSIDEQVKILTGKDEGLSLWVTANYVAGTLGIVMFPKWTALLPQGVSKTLGVLDLGGASTQVSFALYGNVTAPTDDVEKLTLFSKELTVYSDSYLCFGAKEMRNQVLALIAKNANYPDTIEHPCYVTGYEVNTTYIDVFESSCTNSYAPSTAKMGPVTVMGTGNGTHCKEVMKELFKDSPFFDGSVTPLPDRILARGAFAYVIGDLKAAGDGDKGNYTRYVQKMEEWCALNQSEVSKKKAYDPDSVCIIAHYVYQLLANVYKIPQHTWSNIIFANKIGTVDMGWSLGYMTNMTSAMAAVKQDLYYIGPPVFVTVVVISCILIIIGIVSVVLACKFRRNWYDALNSH